MADTTYDILKNRISDINNQIKVANDQLLVLKNNPSILRYKEIISMINAKYKDTTKPEDLLKVWIDANNISWSDSEAAAYSKAARGSLIKNETEVTALQDKVNDLQKQLVIAQKSVTDYEATSPVLKQQLSEEAFNKTLVIVGVIIFIILIFITVKYFINRKNKNKPKT